MNNKLAFVLGLVAGGAAGTFASWRILKAKYKKIADEEIESMKAVLAKKIAEDNAESKEEEVEESEEAPSTFKKVPEEYVEITKKYTNGDELGISEGQKPYAIDPDEFGDHEEYDTETLMYYADGVLAHFDGDIVEDVAGTVGGENLLKFGENENDPDTVYVRNDILQADYEILRDAGKYADVLKERLLIETEE